ncbi:sugar ABC transporter ATP-binding protein [Paracidovorax avenae]|nr:sugar ABC transporter ATP-binding protein [Paracidovorax avenae]
MTALTVSNIAKAYKRYPGKWARAFEWLTGRTTHEKTWVLKNISFVVLPGESVGIIGMNGAGKSTLLKIITGTTQPTLGSVSSHGRVAALLELGMGFHPDFTGRQNVFMAGQLLGLGVDEIQARMHDIEDFAEIGEYIDRPVRMYSSGMQMRLAFSVATAVRPDVLIVDEALSVGDAYFQHKSFERIREFSKLGTSMLIVSHDKQAIQSICDRAILLKGGEVCLEGPPEAVMDYYNAMLAEHQNQNVKQEVLSDGTIQTVSGTGEAYVVDIYVSNEKGERVDVVGVGDAITLNVLVETKDFIPRLVLGYGIKDRVGQVVYGTNTHLTDQAIENVPNGSRLHFKISFAANLGVGSFSVQTALVSTETHLVNNYEWRDLALVFEVININKPIFVGLAWVEPEISISYEENGHPPGE